jgi:hypothetical protein
MVMDQANLMRADLRGVFHYHRHVLSREQLYDQHPIETLCGEVVTFKWITTRFHEVTDKTPYWCPDCLREYHRIHVPYLRGL